MDRNVIKKALILSFIHIQILPKWKISIKFLILFTVRGFCLFVLEQGRVQIILHIYNIIIKFNHEMKFAFREIIRVRIRSFWILIPLQYSHQG